MKLAEGQVVHIGKERFVDEIPDKKAEEVGLKPKPKPKPEQAREGT